MLRLTLLAVLLSAAASAQTAHSIVVTRTADGLAASPPDAHAVGDAPAAVLSWFEGRWSLRVLSEGDVPAEVVARPLPETPYAAWDRLRSGDARADTMLARSHALYRWLQTLDADRDLVRSPTRPARPARPDFALAQTVTESRAPSVEYRVRGTLTGDATAALARLADADGLASLDATTAPDGATQVELSFDFDTVTDWAAWTARPATKALLAPLSDVRTALRASR